MQWKEKESAGVRVVVGVVLQTAKITVGARISADWACQENCQELELRASAHFAVPYCTGVSPST